MDKYKYLDILIDILGCCEWWAGLQLEGGAGGYGGANDCTREHHVSILNIISNFWFILSL